MNAKKKIIISVSAFLVLITAAIFAVVAVLAAQKVKVKSQITIFYHSVEVVGNVIASYQLGSWDYEYFCPYAWLTEKSLGSLSFGGDEDGTANAPLEKSLEEKTIPDLTAQFNFIEFKFTFENTAYMHTWKVELKSQPTLTNIDSLFMVDGDPTGDFLDGKGSVDVYPQTTCVLKIRYIVKDVSKNASIDGDFVWDLKGGV